MGRRSTNSNSRAQFATSRGAPVLVLLPPPQATSTVHTGELTTAPHHRRSSTQDRRCSLILSKPLARPSSTPPDHRPPRPAQHRTMGISSAAPAALCAAFSALELVHHLDPQPGSQITAADQASALRSAGRDLLLLAAMGGLSATVALISRHLHQAGGAGAGAGADNRRLSERFTVILCALAATVEFFIFVQPAGGMVDRGDRVRALGQAALRFLPAAASATFFLGMLLIVVRHIRAGGEGGGTGAVAADAPVQGPVRLLAKMAIGAAAGLVCLMAIALYGA